MNAERIPVIVGIGEVVDRPIDMALSREPLALMADALKLADADAAGLLQRCDSLDVVNQTSWRYTKTAQRVADAAGIAPKHASYGFAGGESPVRYLHQAAMRITEGKSQVGAIVGAEAQYAREQARKLGVGLPWTERAERTENPVDYKALFNPLAMLHETMQPADIYPFYEHAATQAWGQTPKEALQESGALWAKFSAMAASNPFTWQHSSFAPEEITTPSIANRMVCWPYTKRMVANPRVNQGAAIIVTSLALARVAGIPEANFIFIKGGAFGSEPRDYLARDQYARSDAQHFVLKQACKLAGDQVPNLLELYSCFPIVPKMVQRSLGLPDDFSPTVTGGLSFFGAPLNNYMTHAACAMVRALRSGQSGTGLLYGQGEFVTKHHALILGVEPDDAPTASIDAQAQIEYARSSVPTLAPDYSGEAIIETFTVPFDREGKPAFATIIGHTSDGQRTVARALGTDADAMTRLTSLTTSPIGMRGHVTPHSNAPSQWHFA